MLRGRERDRGRTVYAKPVFAVGGTVSGYGSLGSADSLTPETSAASKDKLSVWTSEKDQGLPAMTEELQSLSQARASFKSSFAKELHQENIKSSTWRDSDFKSSFAVKVNSEENSVSDKPEVDGDEYVKVKRENDLLKKKLLDYSKEDEKYKKLQFEIEQLTWQLGKVILFECQICPVLSCNQFWLTKPSKTLTGIFCFQMEQSREVYETATNQLGSFLELVSNRLTIKSGEEISSPELKVVRRAQSENRRKTSQAVSQRTSRASRYLMEDQSLSPSASSSLNTSSCNSESDRNSSRSLRRPSDKSDPRSDLTSEISTKPASVGDGDYDISILSSCTCEEEPENKPRKPSRTRSTLRRITSFMRKDKARNLSLVDSGGPTSMKYSRYKLS